MPGSGERARRPLLADSTRQGWRQNAPPPASCTARPACCGRPAPSSAGHLDVLRLGSLLALCDVELDLLPFLETAVTATCNRAEVHEHIWAAFDLDETVALVAVEPLHRSLRHLDLLRSGCGARHRDGAQRLSQLPWPASPARCGSGSSVTHRTGQLGNRARPGPMCPPLILARPGGGDARLR